MRTLLSALPVVVLTLLPGISGCGDPGQPASKVVVVYSSVDEEVARLGLSFTTRTTSTRRYVHSDAYANPNKVDKRLRAKMGHRVFRATFPGLD